MRADLLHVVTVLANPLRWENRIKAHRAFEDHMIASGVKLTTVECAYGERPHELEDREGVNRVRVRSKTLVWNKENLVNIGISRLPQDWKYVAWIDGDVTFRKSSWAADTVNALQHYDVVQPWSDAYDLGPKDEHLAHHKGFLRQYCEGHPVAPTDAKSWWKFNGGPYDYPHSGYAWAATRHAVEWLGGLIETAAMGAADHHMALSLVGKAKASIPAGVHPSYAEKIYQWEARALHHINDNLGFVWGTIEHMWHGRKTDRKYVDRWEVLTKHQFDPNTDLKRNTHGVLELAGNKPAMRRDFDKYFRQRFEDSNHVG